LLRVKGAYVVQKTENMIVQPAITSYNPKQRRSTMENAFDFKVTRIHKLEEGASNVRAFVDIAVNELLILKGLRIVQGKNGLFISMPREKGKDSKWYEMIHVMSKDLRDQITSSVLSAYHA